MIHASAPYRIGLLGGGSDMLGCAGATLSAAISQRVHVFLAPLPACSPYQYRIVYRTVEDCCSLNSIQHPTARECLRSYGKPGTAVHYVGELPAGTGLGSSSAATVALLAALAPALTPAGTAYEAVRIERQVLQLNGGRQDQWACAIGGLRLYEYYEDNTVEPGPLLDAAMLQEHLLLTRIGNARCASEMSAMLAPAPAALARLARDGALALSYGDLRRFGEMLTRGWAMKRACNAPSSVAAEQLLSAAMAAGAYGGKLLGAGGSGYMLLCIPPSKQEAVKQLCTVQPFRLSNRSVEVHKC